jgi:hypothetical protein
MAKIGRPTKYDPDKMLPRILEMARDGCSKAEIAADIDISHQTWHRWQEEKAEFRETVTRAEEISQAWWESQGRQGIWSREFNASAYSLQVRNRFPKDWSDKHEVTGAGGGPLAHEIIVRHEIVDAEDADDQP